MKPSKNLLINCHLYFHFALFMTNFRRSKKLSQHLHHSDKAQEKIISAP